MNTRSRIARLGLGLFVGALLLAPFIVAIIYQVEFTMLANESLGYRFFYAQRALLGETGLWHPQGFTLSVVQYLIILIHGVGWSVDTLRNQLQNFGYYTLGFITFLQVSIVLIAFFSKRFYLRDLVLISIAGLVPIYCTSYAGSYYVFLPDYYYLNIALNTAAVALFILGIRRSDLPTTHLVTFVLGIWVGLCFANKISNLPMALLAISPWLFSGNSEKLKWIEIFRKSATAFVGFCFSLLIIVAAFWLFDINSFSASASKWYQYVTQPGGETAFFGELYDRIKQYRYSYSLFLTICLAMALTISLFALKYKKRCFVIAICLCAGLVIAAWSLFIYKRPANTTLFEMNIVLVGIVCCFVALLDYIKPNLIVCGLVAGVWLFVALTDKQWNYAIELLKDAKVAGDYRWAVFKKIDEMAHGRCVTIFFPDNSYCYNGVHELLLKGLSTPMSDWTTTSKSLDIQKSMGMWYEFRSNSVLADPLKPLPEHSLIMWADVEGRLPVFDVIPGFRSAFGDPALCETWNLPKNFTSPKTKIFVGFCDQ